MSADSQEDVIKALKAQQHVNGVGSPAAANGNGVHHDDCDETDGGGASKTRREEEQAISELKEGVVADEALAKKMEAAVSVLDEALTAAEHAAAKEKEAVSALEEAALTKGCTASVIEEAASAVKEAITKDLEAETALDEAVLVVGEGVIKNLDKAVSAVDDVAAAASKAESVLPTPTVEVTPAPKQEEAEEEEVTPPRDIPAAEATTAEVTSTKATASEATASEATASEATASEATASEATASEATTTEAAPAPVDAVPSVKSMRKEWMINRQTSEERRREVEELSRPTISKAAMSTSIDEESVRAAYEDVRSDTSDTEWAVFKFQDQNIVCSATGEGFDSFRGHFADNERVFGFIRIQMGDEMSKRQKFVFLTWVGPKVSVIRRAKMSIDKAMVKNIVKNFAVELQVESQAEINEEYLRDQLARVGGANYGTGFRD